MNINADLAVCFPIPSFYLLQWVPWCRTPPAVQRLPHSVLLRDAVPGNCGRFLSKDCAISVFAVQERNTFLPSCVHIYRTTLCHVPQDNNHNIQRCNNFRSHILLVLSTVGPKYLPESCCTFRELIASFGRASDWVSLAQQICWVSREEEIFMRR